MAQRGRQRKHDQTSGDVSVQKEDSGHGLLIPGLPPRLPALSPPHLPTPHLGRLSQFLRDKKEKLENMLGYSDHNQQDEAESMPADVREDDENYYIIADVPGLRRQDVKVKVDRNNVLTIIGKRERDDKENEGGQHERRSGTFIRRFQLPDDVDPRDIHAKVNHGQLVITVRKGERTRQKKDIQIQDPIDEARSVVMPFIENNHIAMFTKTHCPYSQRAKEIMDREVGPTEYAFMDIDLRPDMEAIQMFLALLTGERTVPRIFINGKCIGGARELELLERSGQLPKMLPGSEKVPVE
ncbi:hypothetical protein WJX72_004762 [[Myrmecia] bisecta]|uniref:SHSP domain-containing protein n=1 Tax=[Myrmecia] bisecta TaxID=41462 RepID=A0AAW1PA73_9CHLO